MIMRKGFLFAFLCMTLALSTSCNGQSGEKGTEVLLQTTAGDIRIRLYDDTPGHRDNFVRNVKEGLYDGVAFHRVIRSFMIQTGDPATRPGHEGDTTGVDSTIPAEVVFPKYYHRRGVVAAAREDDDVNPKKESDARQFYIVTGRCHDESAMLGFERTRQDRAEQALFVKKQQAHTEELEALRKARKSGELSDLLERLQDEARMEVGENPPVPYTREQRRVYRTQGGAPWLDGEYTVFGEVVEGMKAVLAIERVKTDKADCPVEDVRIVKASVVE